MLVKVMHSCNTCAGGRPAARKTHPRGADEQEAMNIRTSGARPDLYPGKMVSWNRSWYLGNT